MHKITFLLVIAFLFLSCDKMELEKVSFEEGTVDIGTYQLDTYFKESNSKYLILFESGLGDDHSVWQTKKIADQVSKIMDLVMYDRGGYGQSTVDGQPRTIEQLRKDLEAIVNQYAHGRQVILVGHSLGGMIIRDFAIQNPDKTAAILFVDASHELYNNPDSVQVDLIYNAFKDAYGADSGAALEARYLMEDAQYMSNLPNLPDVPVIALTSMKIDKDHDQADRELWFASKEAMKPGVTSFEHITTTKSGHYIMLEEPNLVLNNLEALLAKLP